MSKYTNTDGVTPCVLRRPQVEVLTGLSRSALYALMERGSFPRPLRLTKRAVGWLPADVHSWVASRAAALPRPAQSPGDGAL